MSDLLVELRKLLLEGVLAELAPGVLLGLQGDGVGELLVEGGLTEAVPGVVLDDVGVAVQSLAVLRDERDDLEEAVLGLVLVGELHNHDGGRSKHHHASQKEAEALASLVRGVGNAHH
eukprot:CAMPEP_0175954272 /NCGR_PEP_ID=MMETSP0108-20121206/31822_1 /TAXON_ID=195067 ORGANISM="Goniomonas pacifica, Strain CCMP1869" /NCGR_SAMPLE_ID=MMETSP0108 /ASSEMBLY_ACC=CAM_ASM_000204 /LENGTH=117 /DNA_ID=CAMNT_0017280941 /DNA_START=77 /DNA_END=430 /DNA_ORIENTATION=-